MVVAAAISVPLSLLIAVILACRRCRKRGRGTGAGAGAKSGKNWSVGDILGRSKEGFRPLNTEEGDGMLDEDSDSEVSVQLNIIPFPYKQQSMNLVKVNENQLHYFRLRNFLSQQITPNFHPESYSFIITYPRIFFLICQLKFESCITVDLL